jgi:small subunit ribosomal protein S8
MVSPSLDFLIRLKNAYTAGKKSFTAPSSKQIISIADLIKKHGFIKDYSQSSLPNKSQELKVNLVYTNKFPSMSNVKIYSKPGRRMYCNATNIPWGYQPNSLIIISTSSGLLSQKQAQKANIGGELIAQIW